MPESRRALVPLAEGVEEMEAVIVIDTLRRAGWEVVAAGLDGAGSVRASRGVTLLPDAPLDAELLAAEWDALVLPGGAGGTERLAAHPGLIERLRTQHAAGRIVASICAAARVLDAAGLLEGRRFTCHPGVADQIASGTRSDERVVRDGILITSQGPGTAFEFALALVAALDGPEHAAETAAPMILPQTENE